MDLDINGKKTGRQTLKSRRKSRRSVLGSKRSSQAAAQPELKPTLQRVFVYLQLKNFLNLAVAAYPLELHLYQAKNTLQKMSEHYTKELIIYQHEFNMDRPAFAMGIIQDSLDDMNMFCDNPLIVTLYQRIPRHRKGQLIKVSRVLTEASLAGEQQKEENMAVSKLSFESDSNNRESTKSPDSDAEIEEEEIDEGDEGDEEDENIEYVDECLEFVSRGHCDLLQLFQTKRFINNIPIMLYPEYHLNLETHTTQKITTTSEWHMYSLLPTLKSLHFTNLAFITLESIFNVPVELHQRADQLGMNLLIRSTKSGEDNKYKTMPLCTFYSFNSQVIREQNIVIVWENIKRDLLNSGRQGVAINQMDTNMHIQVQRVFQNLLQTEGVDLMLHAINPMADKALINNSLHRYVLTPEMEVILEAAVVGNNYQLLLQLYDEDPLNVLYEGVLNLSVFGYPSVNACRFAAQLLPSMSRRGKSTARPLTYEELHLPTFAIVNLCFFKPLTARNEPLDTYNLSKLKAAKLRRCPPIVPTATENKLDILKELYRNFDEIIRALISCIIKLNVTNIKEKPNYFCCCLANLSNLLVKICGNDFNVRIPTRTNVEFREMLTHMHKELMDRVIRVLKDCGMETLGNCALHNDSNQQRMRRLMEEYRYMCMVGNSALAKQVFAEVKADCNNKMLFNFYVFLNSVEMLDFDRAKYYLLHQRESNWKGEYFVDFLEIYIDYQVQLKSEMQKGEAFSAMIEKLSRFAKTHSLDCEGWILLYCFYKEKNYLPGMEYTRWHFENRFGVPAKKMPVRPCPLFHKFMPEEFNTVGKKQRIVRFYEVFQFFVSLGAYAFAEAVYAQISVEFTIVESYLVQTTLKMLQGQIDKTFKVRKIPSGKTPYGVKMRLFQTHINGNAEYSRGRYNEAIAEFKSLLEINPLDGELLSFFRMSLMRMGRMCFDRGDYELSTLAYQLALPIDKSTKDFMVNYGLGVSLYYLNRLEESIVYLARSTQADVFMPDPWGFLAIINLRLDRNKTALNCWKVAKMYPEISLDNRIYAELEKINYSDVYLLAEDNCKPP